MLANVIVATMMPYVMVAMFCFVVIPIEATIFFGFQRATVGFGRSLWLVTSANVASWVAGLVITMFIPVPPAFGSHESSPTYFLGIVLGFILAFFLSWLIEYQYIKWLARHSALKRLMLTVCAANLASYAAVFFTSWMLFGGSGSS